MDNTREKIVVIEADPPSRDALRASMEAAGYEVFPFPTVREGLDYLRSDGADLLLLGEAAPDPNIPTAHETIAIIRGSAVTDSVRVISLVGPGPQDRTATLDFGADDAVSRPWDSAELLARVRAQLHVRRAGKQLLDKMRIADEGQQIAHTAFDALAVTEKMTSNAASLDRRLKIGVTTVLVIAIVMAGTYFLFFHSAQKDLQRTTATIARLERGMMRQEDLM